jgi:hypothetical protein
MIYPILVPTPISLFRILVCRRSSVSSGAQAYVLPIGDQSDKDHIIGCEEVKESTPKFV